MGEELEGGFGLLGQGLADDSLAAHAVDPLHPGGVPAQAAQEVERAAQAGGGRLDAAEQRRGLAHLGHVGVGHLLDLLHPFGGGLDAGDGARGEQPSELAQVLAGVGHAQTDQRIAAAQVVVEERERRADGEAVQPQRHLGELDGERVLVYAVDAPLQHHSSNDGLVGKLRLVQITQSAIRARGRRMSRADCRDAARRPATSYSPSSQPGTDRARSRPGRRRRSDR